MKLRAFLHFGVLVALATGCSSRKGMGLSDGGAPVDAGAVPDAPTYATDIAPIVAKHCEGCHRTGGIAPFPLATYDDAKAHAQAMAYETSARLMPPWSASATERCQPRFGFKNDISLSDVEIQTIARWAEMGAVEGGAALNSGPPPLPRDELSRVDLELPLAKWATSGNRDQYRCFVLDPGFTKPTFVNGIRFAAGNPKVVHHALVFLDPKREGAAKVDPATGSYPCFGSPGVSNTSLITAWAPGSEPRELGDRLGERVPGNAALVVQIHYHPLGAEPEEDQSTLQLRLSDSKPEYVEQVFLIGNYSGPTGSGDGLLPGPEDRGSTPEFRIPANSQAHVERMQFTLPASYGGLLLPALKVLTVGTHMHYVGTDMMFRIDHVSPTPDEPSSECLLETPRWNFHWQRGYVYDTEIEKAPEWHPGDKLYLECTYNNTMANPAVAAALAEQGLSEPRDVSLGEQTLDEMCLAVLALSIPNIF